MATIQKILFPVDFSDACAAMAPFVRRAAAMSHASVTLVHVLEPFSSGFEALARSPQELEEDRKQASAAKLKSFLAADFAPDDCSRLLLCGDPALQIAQAVRDHGFDLIVMPTHAGIFRRTLMGSTTAKVLNDAGCPVLTTQHAETLAPRELAHREWVCAIGLQPDSERVLRYASDTAAGVSANLTILHVIASPDRSLPIDLDLLDRVKSAEKREALDQIEKLQRTVGSRAAVRIVLGPMKDALIDGAARLCADTLIIGRSPQPASSGRLRDLTYAVVRDAPCPVLSV
jgi:nucleotide-binding universal stress UspA family protein